MHVTGGITLAGTTIIQPLGNSLLHVKVVSSFEGHLVGKTNMILLRVKTSLLSNFDEIMY